MEVLPVMGTKTIEPKLYLSLNAAVQRNHIVRRLASAVDFGFVLGLITTYTATQVSRQ